MLRNDTTHRKPLKFVGGDPGLDLINTADWTARGIENERLRDYADLVRWALAAGVIDAARAGRLRAKAAAHPAEARAALREAQSAREVLRRLFGDLARGDLARGAEDTSVWEEFEKLVTDALRRLRLTPAWQGGAAARWAWREEDRLESPLWPVIRSAATLLASDEAGQVRLCSGHDCGWVFVDRSRNGLRRWCEMRSCGTTEKSNRRRVRTVRRGARGDAHPDRRRARTGRRRVRAGRGGASTISS